MTISAALIWIIAILIVSGSMYFCARYATRTTDYRKYLIGVTMPSELLHDPYIYHLIRRYLKREKILLFIFTLAAFLQFFITWSWIQMLYFCLLLIAIIISSFRSFYVYNKLLSEVKAEYLLQSDLEWEDDDQYWIFGMFYCNPYSRKLGETSRYGMGTTINLSTKLGKISMIICIITLLALPAACIWIAVDELAPVKQEIIDDQLIVTHRKTTITINLSDITAIEYLPDLPSTTKSSGTGTSHLLKGRFYVAGYKGCDVILDPSDAPFIYIEANNNRFLFNYSENLAILFTGF